MLKGQKIREHFVFHSDFIEYLPPENTEKWALNIVWWAICGIEPKLDSWAEKELWRKITERIIVDKTNYDNAKEKNRERQKRYREKIKEAEKVLTLRNGDITQRNKTPYTSSVYVSDTVSDSDNVYDSDSEYESVSAHSLTRVSSESIPTETKENQPKQTWVKPTREELEAFCKEKHYSFSLDDYIEYYEASEWKYKDGTFVNWQKACANWHINHKNDKSASKSGPAFKDDLTKEQAAAIWEEMKRNS